MVRIRNLNNKFLRKHRKWPHSPYKTKWHQTFSQQQAMESLKQAASKTPPSTQQQDHNQPLLLSSLLHSFSLYNCDPTPNAYHFAINTLTNTSQLHDIDPILDHLENFERIETQERTFVLVMKAYADANKIQDAVDVFYRIPKFRCVPTVYSINSILSVLCRSNVVDEGLKMVPQVLVKSQEMKIRLEESTFRVLVKALCRINEVGYAIEMLHCMINYGYSVVDKGICSLILKSLSERKDLVSFDVMGFFEGLRKLGFCPDMRDYANVIKLLVKLGRAKDALSVLSQMKSDGIKPDIVCYTMVLAGLVANFDYIKADELFDELLVLGLVPDVYTYNAYINSLCKQNNVEAGIKMVKSMEELGCKPNVSTYNMLLEVLCKGGKLSRAKELMKEMEMKGIGPNSNTYNIMIDGLVGKGEIIEASVLLEEALCKAFCLKSLSVDELISRLCQMGMVGEALELLEKSAAKSVFPRAVVWETLLLSSGFNPSLAETILIDVVNPT